MEHTFEIKENVGLIKIKRTFSLYNSVNFNKSFEKYTEKTVNFVFDLGEVVCMDDILGNLVACLKYASDCGGDLRLANLSEKARMVMEITRVYKSFEIFDDVDEAIKSYLKD